MWPEEDRVRHYFAATRRRAEYLQRITVQKIGSDPTLDEVARILDARRGLHKDYISMEDELDEFINYDTVFIDEPSFYTELTISARKTGGAVNEALSISTEYLNNIGDVDDIYQESMMSCIEWSSRIATLTAPRISIPGRKLPTMQLLNARINLKRTLTRMEAHWKALQEEVRSRDDEIIFSEIQELVETARRTTDGLPTYWNKGVAVPVSSDDCSTLESESEPDDPPTAWPNNGPYTHTESEETEGGTHDNTITELDGHVNDTSMRQTQNQNPDMPDIRLDEDESRNLRHIAETFENIRSDLVTAWNRAMIWVDDEVVFTKLNALLTVTKEATDRVIEATLRAERETNNEPGNAQANTREFSHDNTGNWQETVPATVVKQTHTEQNHPQPLPTRDGHFLPAHRVCTEDENPQPDDRRAAPRRAETGRPVVIKRIETQLLLSTGNQSLAHHREPEELIPSPTMPPLEDPDMWHEYSEFDEPDVKLPAVTRARVTQTLSHLDQCAPALLGTADPTRNIGTQQDTADSQGQKEDQNTGSSPSTVDTNGCTTTQEGIEMNNPMAGSQLRSKLRNLAARRRRAYDNNNETCTQINQDTADNVRKRPHDTFTKANPTDKPLRGEMNTKLAEADTPPEERPVEKKQRPANNNTDGHNNEQSNSTQYTLIQETPERDDPPVTSTDTTKTKKKVIKKTVRCRTTTWTPPGDLITIYESEDEVKLEENQVGAHTPRRRQTDDRDREYTTTVRRKLALDNQTPSNRKTGRPPPPPERMYVGQPQTEIRNAVYADDRRRPQYDYLDIATSDSESSQCPDPYSSDDDGHGDCGLPGGYERCPDNPANYRTTRHPEDDSDENHSGASDRGIT